LKTIELCYQYATDPDLTTYHYRVLFLLMQCERTQAQICAELSYKKQNINKICKDLLSIDYISFGKVVGKNKYLKINSNPDIQAKGQIKMFVTLK